MHAPLLGYFLFLLAALGLAVATIVLRADPKRFENRAFAAMAFVDAINEALRATCLLEGRELFDPQALVTCSLGSITVAYLVVEFSYSFPFNQQLPGKVRAVLLTGAIAS